MCFLNPDDMRVLARYLCAVVDAAAATVQRLARVVKKEGGHAVLRPVGCAFSLYADDVFLKPVTPRQFAEEADPDHQMAFALRVLSAFRAVDVGGAGEYVCSPLGMVSMPPEGEDMRQDMLKALRHPGMCGVWQFIMIWNLK